MFLDAPYYCLILLLLNWHTNYSVFFLCSFMLSWRRLAISLRMHRQIKSLSPWAVDHFVGPVESGENIFLWGLSFASSMQGHLIISYLPMSCFAYQAMLATAFCNLVPFFRYTHDSLGHNLLGKVTGNTKKYHLIDMMIWILFLQLAEERHCKARFGFVAPAVLYLVSRSLLFIVSTYVDIYIYSQHIWKISRWPHHQFLVKGKI